MTRIPLADAAASLAQGDLPYTELFRHGTMSVELYAPKGKDEQTPHDQDELYIVATGSGQFVNGGTVSQFEPGDVLFVPAHIEHRFENFTADFSTWVVFYGPKGGEVS